MAFKSHKFSSFLRMERYREPTIFSRILSSRLYVQVPLVVECQFEAQQTFEAGRFPERRLVINVESQINVQGQNGGDGMLLAWSSRFIYFWGDKSLALLFTDIHHSLKLAVPLKNTQFRHCMSSASHFNMTKLS